MESNCQKERGEGHVNHRLRHLRHDIEQGNKNDSIRYDAFAFYISTILIRDLHAIRVCLMDERRSLNHFVVNAYTLEELTYIVV